MNKLQSKEMWQVEAPVVRQEEVAPGYFLLQAQAPLLASAAKPGQFVMVRATTGLDPLLRRPFSIHAVEGELVSLLYRVVGTGTALLSRVKEGDLLDLLGPLGKRFVVPAGAEFMVLVAGGIGLAPLFFLAAWIRKNSPGLPVRFYYGARSVVELVRRQALQDMGVQLYLATEDGSAGYKGMVTGLLEQDLVHLPPVPVYACGPLPMLKALARLSWPPGSRIQVSLEARMACGLGACLGCAMQTPQGYAHVCREGPVFHMEELGW